MSTNKEVQDDAAKLEHLLSTVMRAIYRQDPSDPLLEFSVPQLRMLRTLIVGPRTPSSLSDELGLSVSAVTQMANRLEAAGILERADDENDRRIKHLTLTERGKELLKLRRERRVRQASEALAQISPTHRKHLVESLQALATAVGKNEECQPLNVVAELEQRLPPAS